MCRLPSVGDARWPWRTSFRKSACPNRGLLGTPTQATISGNSSFSRMISATYGFMLRKTRPQAMEPPEQERQVFQYLLVELQGARTVVVSLMSAILSSFRCDPCACLHGASGLCSLSRCSSSVERVVDPEILKLLGYNQVHAQGLSEGGVVGKSAGCIRA